MDAMTTVAVCHLTGMTYRQADHWATQGYLRPDEANPGSGAQRSWPPDEVRVAYVMAALVRAGVSPSEAGPAARSARLTTEKWHAVLPGRVKATGRLRGALRAP